MPLTRHFYALDEVQAALGYTVMRYDAREALFWCYELLASDMGMHAISTLTETWLWQKGPFRMQWLLSAWQLLGQTEECTEQDVLLVCDQLRSTYRIQDHSMWNIMVAANDVEQPDTLHPTRYAMELADQPELQFVVRGCRQGKATMVWWWIEQQEMESGWAILKDAMEYLLSSAWHTPYRECYMACRGYEALLGFRSDAYDRAFQLLFLLSLCLTEQQRSASFAPLPKGAVPVPITIDQIGRQSARMYTIPTACLYGITRRGTMRWTEHTRDMLYRMEPHLIGCAFWEDAMMPYRQAASPSYRHAASETIEWKSEDAAEEFYQRYFPDDIPDEWTRDVIQRSHGEGVLAPTESITAAKMTRLHFGRYARLAWMLPQRVARELEPYGDSIRFDSISSLIDALYAANKRAIDHRSPLRSLPKKRRILLS